MEIFPVSGETWQPPLTFAFWDARSIEAKDVSDAVDLFANIVGYVKPKVMFIQTTKEVRKELLPKTKVEELNYQIKEYGNLIVAIKTGLLTLMFLGNDGDRNLIDLYFTPSKTLWRFSFTKDPETEDCRIWIEYLINGNKGEKGIHEKQQQTRTSCFSIIGCTKRQAPAEEHDLVNQPRNIDLSYLKECEVNWIAPQEILNTAIEGIDIRPNDSNEF